MVPRNPLRERRLCLFFHNIHFIFSTLGNPRNMAWFLKNLSALTLMAYIKKSDIRGNFRASQFENNTMKCYQASGSTGFTFYSPFPTHQCTHLCSFVLYHTSCLRQPLRLVAGRILFHFLCHEALLVLSPPSCALLTSHPRCSFITAHTCIPARSTSSIFQDVHKKESDKETEDIGTSSSSDTVIWTILSFQFFIYVIIKF